LEDSSLSLYIGDLGRDDERVKEALENLDDYIGRGIYDVLEEEPGDAPLSSEPPYLKVETELAGETFHTHENIEQALEALGFSDR